MKIFYKIKRELAVIRQKNKIKKYNNAIKDLTKEELKVFDMVVQISKKNNYAIRFDPYSDEILILLTDMIITLKREKIFIDNTHGFYFTELPPIAYDELVKIIYKEAHRERRKLKYEVRLRINAFLNSINK